MALIKYLEKEKTLEKEFERNRRNIVNTLELLDGSDLDEDFRKRKEADYKILKDTGARLEKDLTTCRRNIRRCILGYLE